MISNESQLISVRDIIFYETCAPAVTLSRYIFFSRRSASNSPDALYKNCARGEELRVLRTTEIIR